MSDADAGPSGALRASGGVLTGRYDVALLDLDGVVYIGGSAVPHASDSLDRARSAGMRIGFVTNNASRTPDAVAEQLSGMGVSAAASDVVTSAQAAARLVAERVPRGSRVLVVGGVGLRAALAEFDLEPVASAEDDPVAVVQGFSPDLCWKDLVEGSVAVARGLPWIASNTDASIPTPRGRAPGNGTLVAAVAAATGATPVVAGKPEPPLLHEAVRRTSAERALFVGDRLDTDIEGAARVGLASLLVLTGVSDPADLVAAGPPLRPTYLSRDLRGLLDDHPAPAVGDGEDGSVEGCCGAWTVTGSPSGDGAAVEVRGEGDPVDGLRALCAVAWALADRPGGSAVGARATQDALRRLGW